jgi:hypothetical protein
MRHIEVELSLMPAKTKEKFTSILKNFQDKIIKFKRTFNEFRVSRNKLEKNDRSKVITKNILKLIFKTFTKFTPPE